MKTKTYHKGDIKKREHVWDHSGFLEGEEIGECCTCGKGKLGDKVISKAELKKIQNNSLFKWADNMKGVNSELILRFEDEYILARLIILINLGRQYLHDKCRIQYGIQGFTLSDLDLLEDALRKFEYANKEIKVDRATRYEDRDE